MDNSLYNPELLAGRYYPKVVFCYFKEWDGYYMNAHSHNQAEIMYALKGKCLIETSGKTLQMKNGDFILLDANVPHNLIVERNKPCRMLNIEFQFEEKSGVFPSIRDIASESGVFCDFLHLKRPYVFLKDSEEVYLSIRGIINELGEKNTEGRLIMNSHMLQLLLQISRLTLKAQDKMPEPGDLYVRKAIQYMQHQYDCNIKIRDIASEVSIHPVYLHRVFKERTGETIIEYLTRLRLEKARDLLAGTDIPIIEISDYVGMNSRQYFSQTFKKHTGMTPAAYRRSVNRMTANSSI